MGDGPRMLEINFPPMPTCFRRKMSIFLPLFARIFFLLNVPGQQKTNTLKVALAKPQNFCFKNELLLIVAKLKFPQSGRTQVGFQPVHYVSWGRGGWSAGQPSQPAQIF